MFGHAIRGRWKVALTLSTLALAGAVRAESFVKVIPIKLKADITATMRSGDVTVVGWDRKEVKLESEDDFSGTAQVDGDNVRIGPAIEGRFSGCDENVTLSVPGDSRLVISTISGDVAIEGVLDRIKISTVSGDVRIRSSAGPVSIKTVSGDVQLAQIKQDVEIQVVSGDIQGHELQGALLEIKTVSGDVQLRQVAARQVRMNTHSGDVLLQGSFPADASIRVGSFSGNATLVLPAQAGFELDASTRSGSITTDFNLSIQEKSNKKLNGRAGSGGTNIELGSHSGNLEVRSE